MNMASFAEVWVTNQYYGEDLNTNGNTEDKKKLTIAHIVGCQYRFYTDLKDHDKTLLH